MGATPAGLQYLITKSMLQASETLNLVLYLLLKSDQASTAKKTNNDTANVPFLMDIVDASGDIANHPVIQRLNQLSVLTDKLKAGVEDTTPGLNDQMKNLVKAATLMAGGNLSSSDDNDDGSDTSDDALSKEGDVTKQQDEHKEDYDDDDDDDDDGINRKPLVRKREMYRKALICRKGVNEHEEEDDDDDDDDDESESDEEYETEEAIRKVMTEAKFALRNQDIDQDAKNLTKKRKHRISPPTMSSDYGDETDEVTDQTLMASQKLASMMNSIVQKSSSNDKRNKLMAHDDDEEDDYDKVQRGLSMMEEELGKGSDDDDDDDDDHDDEEGLRDSDEDDFYKSIKSKSKARKDAKKVMYEVAPKFPRLDIMVDGERAIGGQIMKNRGLVPHKPKINRNPRVKKREKYRKAIISRKGAVREIRTEEGHVYGGETTGIKSGISRSRKLGR